MKSGNEDQCRFWRGKGVEDWGDSKGFRQNLSALGAGAGTAEHVNLQQMYRTSGPSQTEIGKDPRLAKWKLIIAISS